MLKLHLYAWCCLIIIAWSLGLIIPHGQCGFGPWSTRGTSSLQSSSPFCDLGDIQSRGYREKYTRERHARAPSCGSLRSPKSLPRRACSQAMVRAQNRRSPRIRRRIRYQVKIKILTWLLGFLVIFLSLFDGVVKNLQFWPKSLRSHVRILIYRRSAIDRKGLGKRPNRD